MFLGKGNEMGLELPEKLKEVYRREKAGEGLKWGMLVRNAILTDLEPHADVRHKIDYRSSADELQLESGENPVSSEANILGAGIIVRVHEVGERYVQANVVYSENTHEFHIAQVRDALERKGLTYIEGDRKTPVYGAISKDGGLEKATS